MSYAYVADWGKPKVLNLHFSQTKNSNNSMECRVVQVDEKTVNVHCDIPSRYLKCTMVKFGDKQLLRTYPCFMGDDDEPIPWF
jgi:S-adenosylmethionine hydrolase